MREKKVKLTDPHGMHMRPAGILSNIAGSYECDITLQTGGKEVNAKSIMMIMAAGIKSGSEINVVCEGRDEDKALDAVCSAIEGFDE